MFESRIAPLVQRPTLATCLLIAGAAIAQAQPRDTTIPHLRRQGTTTQLVVDGAPFLVLGGELGNSSASSLTYLRPFWPKLRALNLNTVLAPVSWELIEPSEGRFEFATVDSLDGRESRRGSDWCRVVRRCNGSGAWRHRHRARP